MSEEVDRAIQMYMCSSHAHFATFATYVGATSIGIVAVGLGIERSAAPPIIAVSCLLGIWICFQWHVASLSHRMWCRYYRARIKQLQESDSTSMPPVLEVPDDTEHDSKDYPWWARREKTWTGTRGASLPAVYTVLFALMGLYEAFPNLFTARNDACGKLAIVTISLIIFFALNAYAAWERRNPLGYPDRPKALPHDSEATASKERVT